MSQSAQISGLFYLAPRNGFPQEIYLPQVELEAHATILSTTSRTVLTQTFVNTSADKGIKEVRYVFPLYDGVSVVDFICHVADRTIIGQVKEKDKARAVFNEAVERGETAGLLEQLPDASDVFTTTVGNIPPGAKVIINITYLGELKHDMETDGIRYTIPTKICPRYGDYPSELLRSETTDALGSRISITVNAEMTDGSFIQKIQSPSHPIEVTMGTTTSDPNADPSMAKASATLASGETLLDKDFILQVTAKNTGIPKAVLEIHPTIPHHRALMTTLVPKFALPSEKPEIVFICDRSGSMGGAKIELAVQALMIFLKSLPVGVKFNIYSFGSKYSSLRIKSVTYNQQTLNEAVEHTQSFEADYGGTEMLHPLKAAIEQRHKDMPLQIMMLTDGEVWNQSILFEYLNTWVTESKAPIRVFTLGVGNDVSHALIEGLARAGNGFSQTVGEGEKMDAKVVRMLKGALSPHVDDYTLEVKYKRDTTSAEVEDDFQLIEKVTDSLSVKLDFGQVGNGNEKPKKPISLFDSSVNSDSEELPGYDETGEERYSHLPTLSVPKVLQTPQNIPPLFAFNRTTIYLLLGPEAPDITPTAVVLQGNSKHGPLELEIPIEILEIPGETIHQLAARKAIAELEQGRGWLPEARSQSGKLIKDEYEGHFEDMVEREAVRLGVQFHVGGKWCSFVAVESSGKNIDKKDEKSQMGWEWLEDDVSDVGDDKFKEKSTVSRPSQISPSVQDCSTAKVARGVRTKRYVSSMFSSSSGASSSARATRTSRYMASHRSSPARPLSLYSSTAVFCSTGGASFGSNEDISPSTKTTKASFLARAPGAPVSPGHVTVCSTGNTSLSTKTTEGLLHYLISLQTFQGSWEWNPKLIATLATFLHLDQAIIDKEATSYEKKEHFTTAFIIVVFEEKLASFQSTWELVVSKAKEWLVNEGFESDIVMQKAKKLLE